jgi:hypothetical protein
LGDPFCRRHSSEGIPLGLWKGQADGMSVGAIYIACKVLDA